MLIDFSKIEEVRVPNFKGGEKELLKKAYADGRNCIMLDRLMPGASIGRHTHETNSEIMYIVSGTATFTVGDTVETVQAGSATIARRAARICFRTAARSRSCSSLSLRNSKGSTASLQLWPSPDIFRRMLSRNDAVPLNRAACLRCARPRAGDRPAGPLAGQYPERRDWRILG